ncbi:MAG: hypothetical protein PF447_02985 [Spirochaetaceae bacterium]|jgi:hypothetical protein|nr:hypothetical protein [Spirochaetaceae bacterium]
MRRKPSLLIPYQGPDIQGKSQDVYLYLRPETNGVKVESILVSVIYNNPFLKKHVKMVYLANMPGDYILQNHIIEHHYSLNLLFAAMGKEAFTDSMRKEFSKYFAVPWEEASILGAFEALITLGLTEEELFAMRVPKENLLTFHGQTIKKVQEHFIVNYDMPAILHKNNLQTDILVMTLRITLGWKEFREMVHLMTETLVKEHVLTNTTSASRVFHYSKSPFEEIVDGQEYLYSPDNRFIDEDISFFAYMKSHGILPSFLREVVNSRIVYKLDSEGNKVENNILVATQGFNYPQALEYYRAIHSIYTVTGEKILGYDDPEDLEDLD